MASQDQKEESKDAKIARLEDLVQQLNAEVVACFRRRRTTFSNIICSRVGLTGLENYHKITAKRPTFQYKKLKFQNVHSERIYYAKLVV